MNREQQPLAPVLDTLATRDHDPLSDSAAEKAPHPGGNTLRERFPFLDPPRGPDELGWLGDYRILGLLGEGGMGVVFRAEEQQPRRLVALKVMKPAMLDSQEARQRFLREGQALAEVQHDRVIPIFRVGQVGAVLFLAMPLLKGEPLQGRLARKPLTLAECIAVGRGIAEGLVAIHAAGLVHRDLKPANVFCSEAGAGSIKILDFGLARTKAPNVELTSPGAVVGTVTYMAPEQAAGQALDARADLFSLGCVLYRLVTGKLPFTGPNLMVVLQQLANHHPPPPASLDPAIPPALSDLILRLLAKDPAQRPKSAQAVADELKQLEGMKPTDTALPLDTVASYAPMTPRLHPGRPGKKARLVMALGAALVLGLAAWGFLQGFRHREPTPPAGLRGEVDLRIWRSEGQPVHNLRLNEPGALPLRPGDQYRIEASLSKPGFAYLFWIDTEGKVSPLYPWEPGKWGTRPAVEEPTGRIALPFKEGKGYKIKGDREGMETVLLLVCPSPLPLDDRQIQERLANLGEQRPLQNPLAAVWYENGTLVQTDPHRKRQAFEETALEDPIIRLQAVVNEQLRPLAALTSSVSFARLGK